MAPIFSKVQQAPPRSSKEKIDRWVKQSRPLLDSIFEIMKDVGTMTRMCKGDAEGMFDTIRVKLDTACITSAKLLESLCCLDINRFAKPEKPLTGSLPILFVLMLIVMLYNAFVFGYMPAAGIAINSPTSLQFHAWIFMTLASFAQAVRTDPGSTPTTPRWCNKDQAPSEARERKHCSDEARWCRKSNAYKPDRAHYCRVLQKGVLRMDHYCPWLGNTVGFHNQKFFFQFLFYTNGACAHLGVNFIQFLVHYTLPALTTFCLIGAEGLTVLITSLLVPFFLFHFWLIARNTTTIEFCERMRSKSQDSDEPEMPLRYDQGIFGNFQAVLGSNPLLWLIPVGGPPGDGITFPINPEFQRAVSLAARAAAAVAASDVEKPSKASSCAEEDDDPEATHPAACNSTAEEGGDNSEGKASAQGADIEQGSGDGEWESYEGELQASEEEASEGAGSARSEAADEGFLVWRDSAEFVEDLTVGCQFIGEKSEDCMRNSLLCIVASCVPGTWGRKAARSLASTRAAYMKRSLASPRGFHESSRESLRASSPAVRIVPVANGGLPSGGDYEGESGSSDFLSD